MKTRSIGKTLFAIVIIVFGISLLLDALHINVLHNLIGDWWPSLIILIGIISFLNNPKQILFPAIITVSGIILQIQRFYTLDINVFGIIAPVVIIAVGFKLLNKNSKEPEADESDKVDILAILSGVDVKNQSKKFQGGKISAILGGSSLNLQNAKIKDGSIIDVFAFCGGIDIQVPKNWKIQVSGLPLLGGWENKTDQTQSDNAPTLYIRGTCIMGGFEIKN